MFVHNNIINPVSLSSIDSSSGRFYITPENNKYPSITTVLGHKEKPWLQDWRNALGPIKADKETIRATTRGTAVHLMVERLLNNDPQPTKEQAKEHISEFNSLRLPLKNINNIIAQEIALYSDIMKVAGRVDCIGEYKKMLSIIDFKTSHNEKNETMIEDYFLQTAAYSLMAMEQYDLHINQLVIIMSVETGVVPLVFVRQIDNYIEPLLKRINTFHHQHGKK